MRVYNELDQFSSNLQNQGQSLQGLASNCSLSTYFPQSVQQPSLHYVYCQCSRDPGPGLTELRISKLSGENEVWMDYGQKLKILIADPIKGMHLREAIHSLKEALLEIKD